MPFETVKKIQPSVVNEKGRITNILEEPITHVAIITSKEGAIRGNHYHPKQIQYVYLVSGKYESVSKDVREKEGKMESQIIEAGDLVITPPMIAHAMRFLEDSTFINMTTGHRDSSEYEEHTVKFKVI